MRAGLAALMSLVAVGRCLNSAPACAYAGKAEPRQVAGFVLRATNDGYGNTPAISLTALPIFGPTTMYPATATMAMNATTREYSAIV